jgi:hypothetical protein
VAERELAHVKTCLTVQRIHPFDAWHGLGECRIFTSLEFRQSRLVPDHDPLQALRISNFEFNSTPFLAEPCCGVGCWRQQLKIIADEQCVGVPTVQLSMIRVVL